MKSQFISYPILFRISEFFNIYFYGKIFYDFFKVYKVYDFDILIIQKCVSKKCEQRYQFSFRIKTAKSNSTAASFPR